VSYYDEIEAKMKLGVDILNVAAGKETANLVRWIRERYPQVPIIATGGPSEESIKETIDAGANAISWTPPTNAELFREKMEKYRVVKRHDFMESHDGMTMNEYEQVK
jgi:2-keto-3-deoxy-6-phosphogluconate aldolase